MLKSNCKVIGMKFVSVLIVMLSLCVSAAKGQSSNCGINTGESTRVFKVGEELKIVVSYNWFFVWTDVVDVWLKTTREVKNGKDAIRVSGFGKSRSFYDWFYQVRDIYETWLDPATLRPLFFNRDINEDGYLLKNFYTYNWDKNQIVARIQKKKDPAYFDTISVSPCASDAISLIYNIRNIDFSRLSPGQSVPVQIVFDSKAHDISIKYDKKETIKVKGVGEFRCIKLSAKMVKSRAFTGKENMFIWLTDDQNRLPIYMESPIKVGTIKARITEMSNLKYPLTSKISK